MTTSEIEYLYPPTAFYSAKRNSLFIISFYPDLENKDTIVFSIEQGDLTFRLGIDSSNITFETTQEEIEKFQLSLINESHIEMLGEL